MPHLVLVEVAKTDFLDRMATMRIWLDHQKWEPELFRFTPDAEWVVFEVEFKAESEASSFADAFGGRMLGAPAALSNA